MDESLPASRIALGLGSNQGDSMDYLQRALKALEAYVEIEKISSVYEGEPIYLLDNPKYLNIALTGKTRLPPLALLWTIKNMEMELGRTPTYRNGPHEIDTDIVFYEDLILSTPELIIPHRLLPERDFVLIPLCEIAPDWKHPQTGRTVADMAASFPNSRVKRVGALA